MKDFTKTVQQLKAIEHLMCNDALFQSIAYRMSTGTPFEAAWIAVELGTTLADKIKNIAPQMDVSENEKRQGYELARKPTEAHRMRLEALAAMVDADFRQGR